MKFEEIDFYKREGYGIGHHARGCWVGKKTFEIMWERASVSVHQVDWSELQTAETLYGKNEWRDVKFGRRFTLGRCLRFFEDNDILPIETANKGKKGKRKYRRK